MARLIMNLLLKEMLSPHIHLRGPFIPDFEAFHPSGPPASRPSAARVVESSMPGFPRG